MTDMKLWPTSSSITEPWTSKHCTGENRRKTSNDSMKHVTAHPQFLKPVKMHLMRCSDRVSTTNPAILEFHNKKHVSGASSHSLLKACRLLTGDDFSCEGSLNSAVGLPYLSSSSSSSSNKPIPSETLGTSGGSRRLPPAWGVTFSSAPPWPVVIAAALSSAAECALSSCSLSTGLASSGCMPGVGPGLASGGGSDGALCAPLVARLMDLP